MCKYWLFENEQVYMNIHKTIHDEQVSGLGLNGQLDTQSILNKSICENYISLVK